MGRQQFLLAVSVQRLREQSVGAHVDVVELVQLVHLNGLVLGRADGIREPLMCSAGPSRVCGQ
jgi:hypothetical protein